MTKVLVVGCGGIGLAVAKKYASLGSQVSMVSRSNQSYDFAESYLLDDIDRIIKDIEFDRIIIATGMLSSHEHTPEKNASQFSGAWLEENIAANVMPTARVVQAVTSHFLRKQSFKLMALSARVGSITDNHLGGWYSYRMSKAALNMFIKNVSIEWKLRFPHAGIYSYHPGTVDTQLSAPFKNNVPEDKLFSVDKAAKLLIDNLENVKQDQSGGLIDWKGEVIPY